MRKSFLNKFFVSIASLSLLFNSLATPLYVYAQEETLTPEPTTIVEEYPSPDVNSTPSLEPTPTPIPTETPTPSPTPTEILLQPDLEEPQGSDSSAETVISIWQENSDGSVTTIGLVGEGTEYKYKDTQVKVVFTKLTTPGHLTIKEVKLSSEQKEELGAVTDIAYDISSDMEDGTFLYDLTLPLPLSARGKDIEVKSGESIDQISDNIDQPKEVTNDIVIITGLNHFTIFVVVNSSPPPTNYLQDIVDNLDSGFEILSGIWRISTSTSGYYGSNYITTDNHVGEGQIRWNFTPTQSGTQEIFTRWTAAPNRGTAVPFTVTYDDGFTTVSVNQELNNGIWMSLGTYSFTAGNSYSVTLTNNSTNTNDFVIGDAIKLQNIFDPTEIWVDDDWAGTAVGTNLDSGKVFGYSAFTSIQDGITAVASGGTVNVVAGTYTEDLTINKGVTLQGTGSSSTTITGEQTVTASNVTVDGFTLNGGITINDAANSISGGTISHNFITGSQYGIRIGSTVTGVGVNNVTIDGNTITANTKRGILFYNRADYAAQGVSNITINDNEITNNTDGGVNGGGISTYGPGHNTITNNIITGNNGNGISIKYDNGDLISGNTITGNAAMGINMHQVTNSIVEDNDVSGQVSTAVVSTFWGGSITAGKGSAIYIHENSRNNTIRLNTLIDNKIGVLINKESAGTDPSANSINDNTITGNTEYGILNALGGESSPVVNAASNWWGDISGPNGQGTGIGDSVSANVTFSPWCLTSACSTYSSIYSDSEGVDLGVSQDVTVGDLTLNDVTGTGSLFVAKYDGTPSTGGLSTGVDGYYYDIQYTGVLDFPLNIEMTYSGTFDETHFSSLYYYKDGAWHDYKLDTPASTISIDKDANKITASLRHLTPIVPVLDITPPVVPTLVGPADGAYVKPAGLILDWSDSTDPEGSNPVKYYYKSSYSSVVGSNNVLISPIYTSGMLTNSQINASGSSDHLYYWQVRACDNLSNCSNWSGPWKVTIDKTPPTNPGVPTTSSYLTNNILQNWLWLASTDATSDIKGYYQNIYNVLGDTSEGWSWLGNVLGTSTNLGNGQWQLQLQAEDNAGNKSGVVASTTTTVDTTAPNTTINSGPTGFVSSTDATFIFSADETSTFQCQIDSGGFSSCASPQTYNSLSDGGHTFDVKATDLAGNPDLSPASQAWTVDTTPPVISGASDIFVGNDQGLAGATVSYSVTANDDVDGPVAVNCVPLSGSFFPVWITPVACSATDTAGNTALATFNVTVNDTEAPVITLLGVSPVTVEMGSVYTDDGATALDNVDGDITPLIVTVNPVNTAVLGPYTVTYDVTDARGNAADQVTRTVNVADTTLPVITSISSSSHPLATWKSDRTIDVSWTADDGGGSGIAGYSYIWDTNVATDPDAISEGVGTSNTSTNRSTSQSIYFHIGAVDAVGNWSATTHYGPFWVDANNPTGLWVTPLNNSYLRSTVNLEVSPNDLGSGIKHVMFRIKPVGGSFTTVSTDITNPYQGVLNTTTKADGVYVLRAHIVDNVNRTVNKDINVTIDNTVPTVVSVDSDGETFNIVDMPNQTIKVTFSENVANTPSIGVNPLPGEPQIVNDCGDFDAKTFCFDYTIPADQEVTHTIYVSDAQDAASNMMMLDNSHTFYVDTIAPTLNPLSIASNNADSSKAKVDDIVTLHFFSSEPVKPPTVFIAGHPVEATNNLSDNGNEWLASYQMVDGDSEGPVNFSIDYLDAVDNAGATIMGTTDGSIVTFDKTAPVISDISVTPSPANNPPEVKAKATDLLTNILSALYSIDDASFSNSSWLVSMNPFDESFDSLIEWLIEHGAMPYPDEGAHALYVGAYDAAGNFGSGSTNFAVDTTPPITTFDSPTTNSYHNNPIIISGNSDDGLSDTVVSTVLSYKIHGADMSWQTITSLTTEGPDPFLWTYDWVLSADGAYDIRAEATDDAGNTEDGPTVENITYDATDPTGAWVTPAADSTVHGTVALEVMASDDTAGIKDVKFQYKRNIEGAEWQDIATDSESPFTANWDTTGLVLDTYALKAIITDKAENFVEITRIVNVAAVVSGEGSTTPSESSAVITWTTDRPTKSRVVYDTVSHGSLGAAPNYGYAYSTGTFNEDPKVLSHSVTITGLGSGTVYYYRTISEGSPVAIGDERTYKTLSTAGAPAPAPWSGVVAGISTVATVPWITGVYYPVSSESISSPTTEEVKPEENKEVLGEETEVRQAKKTWIWIIVIALIAFMGFIYLRKRSKKS